MTLEDLTKRITDRLSEFLGHAVTADDLKCGYDEIGADSMDVVVLAFELEEWMGFEIPPEVFMQHSTIEEALHQVHDLYLQRQG